MGVASCEVLIDGLARDGWASVAGFLPAAETAAIARDARASRDGGGFEPAAIGLGARRSVVPTVRGDERQWWSEPAAGSPRRALFEAFEDLRRAFNRELFTALSGFEAHYAYYPPGRGYARHLDDDASGRRIVSAVFYLNEGWEPADGGELALYTGAGTVRVPPEAGRLAVFRTRDTPHEVLPNARGRWSVTAWFSSAASNPAAG